MAWTAEEALSNIYAMTKSQFDADQKNVLPVLTGQLSKTIREETFYILYARIHGNVHSMLKLDETNDVQALAMISRSILELTMDLKLIDKIPNSLLKILTFVGVQRLKAARTVVEFKNQNPSVSLDVTNKQTYIQTNGSAFDIRQVQLWPDPSNPGKALKIPHWSGLDARARAAKIGLNDEARYVEFYGMFSWHVHPGLTATANLSDAAVRAMIFMSWKTALDCYQEVLAIMVKEFKLYAVEGLLKKIETAVYEPFLKE